MRRFLVMMSAFLLMLAFLIWIGRSINFVAGDWGLFALLSVGLYAYTQTYNQNQLTKNRARLFFDCWGVVAGYCTTTYAQHLGYAPLHTSITFLQINEQVTYLNYFLEGAIPVLLFYGMLYTLETLLDCNMDVNVFASKPVTPAPIKKQAMPVTPSASHVVIAKPTCPLCEKNDVFDVLYGMCEECKSVYSDEIKRVKAQNARTAKLGLESTLTPVEWIQTLKKFKFLCAYCQSRHFDALDHHTPVTLGGGTTKQNAYPACTSCNTAKSGNNPIQQLIIAKK